MGAVSRFTGWAEGFLRRTLLGLSAGQVPVRTSDGFGAATTAHMPDSADKRYCTDAQKTDLGLWTADKVALGAVADREDSLVEGSFGSTATFEVTGLACDTKGGFELELDYTCLNDYFVPLLWLNNQQANVWSNIEAGEHIPYLPCTTLLEGGIGHAVIRCERPQSSRAIRTINADVYAYGNGGHVASWAMMRVLDTNEIVSIGIGCASPEYSRCSGHYRFRRLP